MMGIRGRIKQELIKVLSSALFHKRERFMQFIPESVPFITVSTSEGLQFLLNSKDRVLATYMLREKRVWAYDEMDFVIQHLDKSRKGVFLDIGANIGTTSIFMKKVLGKETVVFAFEPVVENYKMLCANCILNDTKDIRATNIGLSDNRGSVELQIDYNNMASSRVDKNVLEQQKNNYVESTCAQFMTLNDFAEENMIDAGELIGIWIDTEGHEPEVFFGGSNIFSQCSAPVYMEFNPGIYRNKGVYDTFVQKLMEIYEGFICWEDYAKGNTERRPISELPLVEKEMDNIFCNLLLFK